MALHRIRQLGDDHIEQVTTKLVEGQAKLEAKEKINPDQFVLSWTINLVDE